MNIDFKDQESKDGFFLLRPAMMFILTKIETWAKLRKITPMITSTVRPMIIGVSKTDIHSQGRAVDLSIKNFLRDDILDFESFFNGKYSEAYGAFSSTDKIPRLVIRHVGTADHFHVQVRDFTPEKYLYL